MTLITWTDSLSVHVEEFDRQHRQLITMINQLNDAMRDGKGADIVGPIIDGLVRYTRDHFQAEERQFAAHGYPLAAAHKTEHDAFVRQVLDFKKSYESRRIGLSVQVMQFLGSWLKTHIQESDRKYATHLNGCGVR